MTTLLGRAHLLSTAFGVVMVAAAGIQTDGPALALATVGAFGVLAGVVHRGAATAAVLSSASAVAVSQAPPMPAAVAGLAAACYLVLRYTERDSTRLIGASATTMLAALCFAFVGVVAASFPFELPWLPLLAPLAVFGSYVLATRPFYTAAERGGKLSSRS